MKVIMKMKWNGVSPKQYEEVKKHVNWEGEPPVGLLLHIAGFSGGALHITDMWESAEHFENFSHDRLMKGVAKTSFLGILPEVEVFPAYAVYSPSVKI